MWLMICKQLINRWRSSLSVCLELLFKGGKTKCVKTV